MFVKEFFGKDSNITEADLNAFLGMNDERGKIEFKASISNIRDAILEPIVEFANSVGGLLVLGVSDNKRVIGLKKQDTKERVNNIIRDRIEPKTFSTSHYYDIHKIKLSNGKHILIIDIRAPAGIVGFKCENNYFYYSRKGNSKELLTPSELYDVALLKGEYRYNWLYRRRILNTLIRYDDLYDLLTNRDKDEIFKLAIKSIILFGSTKKDDDKLKQFIMKTQLKTLSVNVYEVLLDVYRDILDIRLTVKYRDLSTEEDDALNELVGEYAERFYLGRPATIDKIADTKHDSKEHGDLSLQGYLYNHYDYILKDLLKPSTQEVFLDNKIYLLTYEENLVGLRMKITSTLQKLNIPVDDIENALRSYDEFPEQFLMSLIPLMRDLERYKQATSHALYLEDEDSDNDEP